MSIKNGELQRTTIVLPTALDKHLDILSLRRGISKSELVRKAVEKLISEDSDLRPDRNPSRILVEYDD